MQLIGKNVYVEIKGATTAACNPSFVTTSEGIVLIDTPYLPMDAIKWREEIAKRGEMRYIINTEHHNDHTTGNFFFPGPVIAHQQTRVEFANSVGTAEDVRQRFRNQLPEAITLLANYQPKPPSITFSERLTLYLGEHSFELMHLPGHTLGQIGVYIPQEKVVFTGDNFANGVRPSLAYAYPYEWVNSLKKLLSMEVDWVVPGHGQICGKDKMQEFVAFLEECFDKVKESIRRGMSREDAADRITLEEGMDKGQQKRSVLRLYDLFSRT